MNIQATHFLVSRALGPSEHSVLTVPGLDSTAPAAHRELPHSARAVQGWGVRRGCLGQEGPAPTLACSAQMAGAAATSWAALLRRSLWGDIPFPTGPGKALVSSSLEPAFFLGCGLPPPPQHGWQAPGLLGSRPPPPGSRSLEGLGPGPHGRDQHMGHHCGHYLPQCTRMTDSDSFPLGTESLGPG